MKETGHVKNEQAKQYNSVARKNNANTPFFQPKLAVAPADDIHEKEADNMAEKVMRMPAGPDHEQFFSPKPIAPAMLVNRKCACAEEEKVQRKEEAAENSSASSEQTPAPMNDGGSDEIPNSSSSKPAAFHTQRKATDTIHRKCSACEEEREIQRKENNAASTSSEAPPIVSQALSSGGQPMDSSTQEFMSGRFGYDFSNVKIHTGDVAAKSAQSINALAYTSGSSIVFNDGQYSTGTESGKKLLAHELTHVVQQNPSLQKKSMPGKIAGSTRGNVIQRYLTFGPDPRPKGTLIHSTVLPMFATSNSDLFVEVKIPGANKKDVDKGVTGVADFYKANDHNKTIGIKFDNEPEFLTSNGRLQGGGATYSHNREAAPAGGKITPRVRRMDSAPEKIEIGDLKPGGSAEVILGVGQIQDYQNGITNTATSVNNYLTQNPKEHDGTKNSWNPKPANMGSLTIPPVLDYPSGTGISRNNLALYSGDSKIPIQKDTSLVGSMYVYSENNGIWSYEWIPDNVGTAVGSGMINNVLNRLNTQVIPTITAANQGTVTPKRMTSAPPPVVIAPRQLQKKIQKKDKEFKAAEWEKDQYNPWKEEAKTFLGNDKEVGKAKVAEGAVEVSKRTGGKLSVPAEVAERGKGLGKIKHWNTFGKTYGFLREKFNFLYVKISGVIQKVKDKVKKFAKSSAGTAFGNWVKAVAKVIFKIFKLVGSWVIHQTVDKLLNSFKQGISNNINKLIERLMPEEAEKKLAEFEEKKTEYENIIQQKEEEIIKFLFGDKIDLFDMLEKWESIASTASTIVDIVKWGIRIIACASPPALGCLWNLAVSAIEYLFSKLMETCWFTKKAIGPVMKHVNLVKEFPTTLATGIVDAANKFIPLPAGMDPLFAPIPQANPDNYNYECGEGGDSGGSEISGDREAILDLAEKVGNDKLLAFVEMASKKGAGPWTLLTKERIDLLKEGLQKISAEDIKKLAKEPDAKVPVELEQFMNDIKSYTPKEKKLIQDNSDKVAGNKEEGKKGSKDAGDPGKSGGAKEDPEQQGNKVMYGPPPGKIDGKVNTIFAAGILGSEIKTPEDRKDAFDISLGVGVFENGKSYKVILHYINVRVSKVDNESIYLENQKEFSTYYTDQYFLVMEKGKIFRINKKDVTYQ